MMYLLVYYANILFSSFYWPQVALVFHVCGLWLSVRRSIFLPGLFTSGSQRWTNRLRNVSLELHRAERNMYEPNVHLCLVLYYFEESLFRAVRVITIMTIVGSKDACHAFRRVLCASGMSWVGVCKSYYYAIPYEQYELFKALDALSAKDYDNSVRGLPSCLCFVRIHTWDRPCVCVCACAWWWWLLFVRIPWFVPLTDTPGDVNLKWGIFCAGWYFLLVVGPVCLEE